MYTHRRTEKFKYQKNRLDPIFHRCQKENLQLTCVSYNAGCIDEISARKTSIDRKFGSFRAKMANVKRYYRAFCSLQWVSRFSYQMLDHRFHFVYTLSIQHIYARYRFRRWNFQQIFLSVVWLLSILRFSLYHRYILSIFKTREKKTHTNQCSCRKKWWKKRKDNQHTCQKTCVVMVFSGVT